MARVPKITADELQAETSRLYSLADLGLAQKEVDPKAWTLNELNAARRESNTDTLKLIRNKLESGEWEQVWKESPSGRLCKAYRPKGGRR